MTGELQAGALFLSQKLSEVMSYSLQRIKFRTYSVQVRHSLDSLNARQQAVFGLFRARQHFGRCGHGIHDHLRGLQQFQSAGLGAGSARCPTRQGVEQARDRHAFLRLMLSAGRPGLHLCTLPEVGSWTSDFRPVRRTWLSVSRGLL